jgi:hypothetical protein
LVEHISRGCSKPIVILEGEDVSKPHQ